MDVTSENLVDLGDFDSIDTSGEGQGTQTGDMLPFYNNFTYIYKRKSRGNRNGWKRFTGVPESAQAAGILNSGFVTAVAALATALQTVLTDGDGNAWSPRIYRAPTIAVPDFDSFPIAGVEFHSLSTQNSRKFGRGV